MQRKTRVVKGVEPSVPQLTVKPTTGINNSLVSAKAYQSRQKLLSVKG